MVIGGGVGGLATAALLAKAGCSVTVLEAHVYAGGCAGTFTHKGYRFDAGATVAGGFQAGGPHEQLGRLLELEWPVRPNEPAWVVHLPGRSITFDANGSDLTSAFPRSAAFWSKQRELADLGWQLGAAGLPWPPGDARELTQLAGAVAQAGARVGHLLPYTFCTVENWLKRSGLAHEREFRRLLDAQLLISAQATSDQVNALWGATALDLARQGTMQVAGGMGGLAQTLASRLHQLGGKLQLRQQVTRIVLSDRRVSGVMVRSGRRAPNERMVEADFVIANVTPWNLARLLGKAAPAALQREARFNKPGLGAFVLHLGVADRALPEDCADHHQVVSSLEGPLGETRSLFVSLSPRWDATRAPVGHRAITVSTHTLAEPWLSMMRDDRAAYEARKAEYTGRLLHNMERALPGFRSGLRLTLAGTPVTWRWYTGRHRGQVGGFPMTSLLRARGPRCGLANLRLVGDSVFPGQSTAGVVAGAMRVARDVMRQLPAGRCVDS